MKKEIKFSMLGAALAVCTLPAVAQSTSNATPAKPRTIHQRQENQQDRIAQGVKSGQLTAGEAARLERNQARINREIRHDRKANGGKLTPQERAQIARQQNRQSRQIYRDKHNDKQQ